MTPQRPNVRPWRWDMGRDTEQHGAQIRTGGQVVFIPAQDLRRVADVLHDAADQLESEQQ